MKILIYILLFLISSNLFSQSFFKNAKPLLSWKVGDTDPITAKLKKGGSIRIKFDGTQVNVEIIFGNKGYAVNYFEENEEWSSLQIAEYDFEGDGMSELLIAYGDKEKENLKVLIYQISKSQARQIGSFEGQSDCTLSKNKIRLDYGETGLFSEYILVDGKFVGKK